ncbi:MAG TPA: hypothetical protein VKK31_11080 [Thermoanaerobaculia bacterium]|nr:hypothetical protein [Thermoanaerobaculia bacterium]
MKIIRQWPFPLFPALVALLALPAVAFAQPQWTMTAAPGEPACPNGGSVVTAHVAAIDQAFTYNRLGAELSNGMMFALARDVFPKGTTPANETEQNSCRWQACTAGNVQLRSDKRPRPIVLRVNEGQCLQVVFSNFLAESGPGTADASVHIQGMEWLQSAADDGSWVGGNASSLVAPRAAGTAPCSAVSPNCQHVYTLFAAHEGSYLLYSTADTFTTPASGDGGQLSLGLFGALNVQPAGAEWYRSQVTEQELCKASRDGSGAGACTRGNPAQLPQINYRAVYQDPALAGVPVLNLLACPNEATNGCPNGGELVHTDVTAIISGRTANGQPGPFPATGLLRPVFNPSYALPDRLQPYREFTIVYHEVFGATQAFPDVYANVLNGNGTGADNFSFNYGMAGIGSEILANRFGVGPMADCTSCKYEEFFLASSAVGDPAMVVDVPANSTCTWNGSTTYDCTGGKPATKALYPDDPSNVYHSYMADHTKFRILHAGVDLHHLHHQHAHQWMHSPDTPNGDYTDSQSIGPGSSFTLEMVYNGSGNVNQTVGDSIFHCHFYPHFAAGMWSLWRVHDVFEPGTEMDADGRPKQGAMPEIGPVTVARALPDGEITAGTPIPGLVPLPTRPMAPMPAKTVLVNGGKEMWVCRTLTDGTTTECRSNLLAGDPGNDGTWKNPGYPFYIPIVGGQRTAHPPMDFAYACSDNSQSCTPAYAGQPADLSLCGSVAAQCVALDGGLPRHLILGGGTTDVPPLNPQDFSKTLESVSARQVAEEGTLIEKVAMQTHAVRFHNTQTPEGTPARFTLNGLPPKQGAPYADPCINYSDAGGTPAGLKTRRYKAADFQLDAIFNKEGWHFPQQRMLALWGDVKDTLNGVRPPEPFFFRANSGECIEYTHANLVPNVYELDDFEVRTPTDILGQHIHLVKFDVTSSDGATNGFNYEDGTFAPNEVVERIDAIRTGNQCTAGDTRNGTFACPVAKTLPFFGPGPGGQWVGAQATIQRWYADPLFDGPTHPPAPGAQDRTLRTVFTHDHFGPSTHQQAGLYAGLVIEPTGSNWYSNEIGAGIPDQLGGVASDGTPLVLRQAQGYAGLRLPDGGPTSWQAVIRTATPQDSFREFLLEIQDSTLIYAPFDTVATPAFMAQGFCADSPTRACTPATAGNYDRPGKGCTTGPCIGLGYCSNNQAVSCPPSPWASPDEISTRCGASGATCNLIVGVPGKCQGCASPPVQPQVWGTTALDAGSGPEVITLSNASDNFSFNYRNEPLTPRLNSSSTNPNAGDLSYVYTSMDRGSLRGVCSNNSAPCTSNAGCTAPATCTLGGFCSDNNAFCTTSNKSRCASTAASCKGFPYPPLTAGVQTGDPFTPLLRSYAGDDVQVRTLMGGHINPHNFTIQGIKWLLEPSMTDSGWRNSLVMGISEHFEELFRLPTWVSGQTPGTPWADYLYMAGASVPEQQGGNWGLLRAYGKSQPNLRPLQQNPPPADAGLAVCPDLKAPHKMRKYTVVATTAQQALGGPLNYNTQLGLNDPNGILFFNFDDLSCPGGTVSGSCTAKSKTPAPLVLRAGAGDCIEVTLYNVINPSQLAAGTSTSVGLHPQLVSFDATQGSGFNAGSNPIQTIAPGTGSISYTWYAGNIDTSVKPAAYIPIEFGAANLMSSDIVNHFAHGLFGALVIEPEGADWPAAEASRISTVVTVPGEKSFREFVLITRDLLNLQNVTNVAQQVANMANYGTEPLIVPLPPPGGGAENIRYCDNKCLSGTNVGCVLSQAAYCCTAYKTVGDDTVCSSCSQCAQPPATPTFQACAGEQVRFRVLHAGGNTNTNQVFELYGHVWAETPYQSVGRGCIPATTHTNLYSSSIVGDAHRCTPAALGKNGYNAPFAEFAAELDSLTDWQGSRMGHGPTNHYDVLINSAGGINAVPGDYLYRSYPAMHFRLGLWGVFQVLDPAQAGKGNLQCIGSY